MAIEGAVQLNDINGDADECRGAPADTPLVDELTGGGEHFDDDTEYLMRRRITQAYHADMLPRTSMSIHITNLGLRRPVRNLNWNINW